MELVAESILEVVLLVDRETSSQRSFAGSGDFFLGFFDGGDSGDAGAGAGLMIVGDAVRVAVAASVL